MKDAHIEIIVYFTIIAVIFLMGFCVTYWKASQEAKSYNKFCDTPVTAWDALWLDLRIDECN